MDRMTGIVMEQEGNHVVVLTSTGEFQRVRCKGKQPDIGQEIVLSKLNKRNSWLPRLSFVAAAAAILIFALMTPLTTFVNQPAEKTVAWVTVDINPSLELAVGDKEHIVNASGLNEEGKKLLRQVDVVGMTADEAITELTEQSSKLGYIKNGKDNSVLISVASDIKQFDSQKLEQKLVVAAQDVLTENRLVAVVQTVKVTTGFREKAKEKNISAGKYAVLVEAVNSGVIITEEELKSSSVTDAIKKAGGKPDEILKRAHDEEVEQLPEKEKRYLMIAGEMERDNKGNGSQKGENGKVTTPEDPTKPKNPNDVEVNLIDPIKKPDPEKSNNSTKPAETNNNSGDVNKNPSTGGQIEQPAGGNDSTNSNNNSTNEENKNSDINDVRGNDNSMD